MDKIIKNNKEIILMNAEFAEFVGIFIGDGSLNIREKKCSYEFKFTGNLNDEIPYFKDHVAKVASKVLNRRIVAKNLDSGRSIGLYFCSKELAKRFKGLGINGGPKAEKIEIPRTIAMNRNLAIACIRGIFDTDGCFTLKKKGKYPVITFSMKNRKVMIQVKTILGQLGIKSCISFDVHYFDPRTNKTYTKHYLSINGKEHTKKWFDIVGTNNPKNITKYKNYLKRCKNSGVWI